MRIHRQCLAALISGCIAPLLLSAQPQKQAVFPQISSYNLNKQKIDLPGGLAGQTDLLIISFEPEQQKEVDSWLPAAQAVQHSNFQFRYYELPVSGKENFLFRWWETSSMRNDQSDPVSWNWTIPLFLDKDKFLHQLDIHDQKHVTVLLIDRQGHVLWRTAGPLTPEKRAELMSATSNNPGNNH